MSSLPYRMRSDSWQPARWRRNDHLVLMFGLLVIAYIRGLDYLLGMDVWNSKDFMLAAAPEWVWGGVGFLTGALILNYAIIARRHLFVYIGHWWLGISYGLNAMAAILASGPEFALPLVVASGAIVYFMVQLVHHLSQAGHRMFAFALSLLGVGAFALGIHYSHSFDGMRGGGSVGLVAVLHIIQAFRTGARPLRLNDSEVKETVVTDGGE